MVIMDDKKMKLVPALRFGEFEGEWEETKLESCISLLTDYHSNGSYERLKENVELLNEENYAIMIRTTNLEKRDYKNNLLFINKHAYNFLKKSKVFPSDIIINKIANAGSTYLMPRLNQPVSLAMNLFLLRVRENYSSEFIFFQIKSQEYRLRALASGTSTKTITKNDVRGYKIRTSSLPEQQKIANFLSSVDKKIEQLRQKVSLLEDYKKGVMQQIFSQQIRFKDDNGEAFVDWEVKRLGEVFELKYGKDYKHLSKGTIPVMGTGGIMFYVNEYLYDKPSVLIGRKGSINKPKYIDKPFWTVDTLFYTKINEKYIPYFIYLVVSNINWLKYNEATGVPSLNSKGINSVKVIIPKSLKEQQKIANYLSSIDDKIEQTKTQLKQAQTFKKGLLQQLFV